MPDDFDEAFITAVERLGMVNNVVPLDDLGAETCAPAAEIAKKHPFAARQATP
jgi:1,4-dihydroxy-2-naphthoyl-CoA synthase